MFVRTKLIGKNEYAYLVENSWTPLGPRQRVAGYAGRVHRPGLLASERAPLCQGSFASLVRELCRRELLAHGFADSSNTLRSGELAVNLTGCAVRASNSKAAIAMHEGFLCDATLNALLQLKPSGKEEADMQALMTALLSAGLTAEGDELATLYAAWRKP